MEVRYNVANGYSWNWGGLIFGDKDEEILEFKYNGKTIALGKKISGFDAEGLLQGVLKMKH